MLTPTRISSLVIVKFNVSVIRTFEQDAFFLNENMPTWNFLSVITKVT